MNDILQIGNRTNVKKHIINVLKVLLWLVLIFAFLFCAFFIYLGLNINHDNA